MNNNINSINGNDDLLGLHLFWILEKYNKELIFIF